MLYQIHNKSSFCYLCDTIYTMLTNFHYIFNKRYTIKTDNILCPLPFFLLYIFFTKTFFIKINLCCIDKVVKSAHWPNWANSSFWRSSGFFGPAWNYDLSNRQILSNGSIRLTHLGSATTVLLFKLLRLTKCTTFFIPKISF